jgi:hypothetical protein
MRMALLMTASRIRCPQLKPPDMIPELHSGENASLGQLDQVSVDRGPIKALVCQGIRYLGVCLRTRVVNQVLQHREPCSGAPQANSLEPFPEIDQRCWFLTSHTSSLLGESEVCENDQKTKA